MNICTGTYKNGSSCKFKASQGDFCKVHMPKECGICYKDVIDTKLPCKHSFCTSCIKKWLLDNDTCPYCRVVVHSNTLRKYGISRQNQKKERKLFLQLINNLTRLRLIDENDTFVSVSVNSDTLGIQSFTFE